MSFKCFNHRIKSSIRLSRHRYPTNPRRNGSTFPKPPFPVVTFCPSPTGACCTAPADLDIDRYTSLHGTIAPYAEQILISTGKADWESRIEEDEDAVLLRALKGLLGRGGKYRDNFHNLMLTHSSFSTSPLGTAASAYLFPSFRYVPNIPLKPEPMETFVQAFLLPQKLHPVHLALGKAEQDTMLRKPELQSHFDGMRDVDEVVVLICGHGGRDKRCGDMGPLLQWQFKEVLPKQGFHVCENESNAEAPNELAAARVGLISHIGGHKFAGNVIVYIPPRYLDESGQRSPLAGRGIWYGRVEPKHVEGIVRETILQGRVISELFRGAVGQGETIMDL